MKYLDAFELMEIAAEFSRAMRHSLISIASLNGVDGTNRQKVAGLGEALCRVHEEATVYLAELISLSRVSERLDAGGAEEGNTMLLPDPPLISVKSKR